MKKSHERFGEIIREHFDNVEPAEFRARLHEASHGAYGDPAPAATAESTSESRIKRAVGRVARAAAAVASRTLSVFHLH